MAYLYRVESIKDFDDYLKIKSDPIAILWSGFATAPDPERLKKHFEHLLNDCFPKGDILFYLKDDETGDVMGYDLMTKIDDETVESSAHSILSNYQGKGLGTLLLKRLTVYARELGYKKVIGWISENNIGSIMNFERNGFVKTNESRVIRLATFDREDTFYKYECIL